MNPIRQIRRIAGVLAGACALLAFAAASPAMAARNPVPAPGAGVPEPYPGANLPLVPVPPQIRTVLAGGMPGWQITLIAVGAALLAAVLAVLADRARRAGLAGRPA